ncbi:MAG TPA: MFS transporter [Thermoplasmata archaeon]|nr:MFS transporter [Thermoplasmata archaeon]
MAISVRTWPSRLVARPWLLAFVPINAATAGFGVALPLLILIPLHGSWADVALAATLFNASVILSSVAWGHLADTHRSRRVFLILNYGGYAVLYLVLTHVGSIPLLDLIYTAIGLLAPAGTSASNLLILEKFPSAERATAFASFQEMSMIGSVAGLLIGYFWTVANDALLALLYVLAVLAAVSAAALWFGIREGAQRLTTAQVARHPESLASRLHISASFRIAIPFFPKRPSAGRGALGRFRRWVLEEMHHELPLVMGAMFLFNLASNLFNISYTPYLYSLGLGVAAIFLVNFGNNFAQVLLFPLSGRLANRFGPDGLVRWSTYVRSLGYLATAGFTFVVLLHGAAFGANLIAFAILGGAIAIYTTASSLILFRGIEGRDAGGLLGVNSALGGAAAVLGAVLSGVLSVFGSYRLVFLVAAGALLISVPLWTAAGVAYRRRAHPVSPGESPLPAAPARVAGPADAAATAKPH